MAKKDSAKKEPTLQEAFELMQKAVDAQEQAKSAPKPDLSKVVASLNRVKKALGNAYDEFDKVISALNDGSYDALPEPAEKKQTRAKSVDKQAQYDINRATYVSEYPNGLDEKTGLPKRKRGNNREENAQIDTLMQQDLLKQKPQNGHTEENHPESLADTLANDSANTTDNALVLEGHPAVPKPKRKK